MTKVKDNPMDESAHPAPRPVETDADRIKKKKSENENDKNAKGKTDKSAFDAKNNNMTQKG